MKQGFTSVFCALLATCAWTAQAQEDVAAQGRVSSHIAHRIVKNFDFNEASLGNYESMPMNWRPQAGPGYPRYLEPRFDMETGHDAPPCLRFSLIGGSMAACYVAQDISADPHADYLITAWVRTHQADHAGASVSAWFLDHAMRKIDESQQTSERMTSRGSDESWHCIRFVLKGGFERARWIGLGCSFEQDKQDSKDAATPRPIEHHDVHATAWFDDITITRLPQVQLKIGAVANIFPAGRTPTCTASIIDVEGADLNADLEILAANGERVACRTVPIESNRREFQFAQLPPGYYEARLLVKSAGRIISESRQSFVRLNSDLPFATGSSRMLGILEDKSAFTVPEATRESMHYLGAGSIKLPVWRADLSDDQILRGEPGAGQLIHQLATNGIDVFATLDSAPDYLTKKLRAADIGMSGLLAMPPQKWRAHLAMLFLRYAADVRGWQFGPDFGHSPTIANALPALINVQKEMESLVGKPNLVSPRAAASDRTNEIPQDVIRSTSFAEHISANRMPEYACGQWAALQLPNSKEYQRAARTSEVARRFVRARVLGAERVFVPSLWKSHDKVVEPTEDFLTLRTLAQALGDRKCQCPVWLDHGISAWLFADDASSAGVVVAWSEGDSGKYSVIAFDVGNCAEQIDLLANRSPLIKGIPSAKAQIGSMPLIIGPVDAARVRTMASFGLDLPNLSVSLAPVKRTIRLTNAGQASLKGVLRLTAPPGWRISPRRIMVELAPLAQLETAVSIQLPSNQSVGNFVLEGQLQIDGLHGDRMMLRAPLTIESSGLDVQVTSMNQDGAVRLVTRVTNKSPQPLTLAATVIAEGSASQTSSMGVLQPGQTVERGYQLHMPRKSRSNVGRLLLEQVDGPMRCNQLFEIK